MGGNDRHLKMPKEQRPICNGHFSDEGCYCDPHLFPRVLQSQSTE